MTTFRRSTREQRELLIRLGIELSERWAWISTDGAVTAEHVRWRIDTGAEDLHIPLVEAERWEGFGYDALGLVRDPAEAELAFDLYGAIGPAGLVTRWGEDLYILVRWQRVTIVGSPLYAELITGASRDAAIRNAHLAHPARDRDLAWKAMDRLLVGPRPGAPRGERAAFRTEDTYRNAIRELHRRAVAQRWDLTNESVYTPAWIARQLERIAEEDFSARTMERRNQKWGITLAEIRRGEV